MNTYWTVERNAHASTLWICTPSLAVIYLFFMCVCIDWKLPRTFNKDVYIVVLRLQSFVRALSDKTIFLRLFLVGSFVRSFIAAFLFTSYHFSTLLKLTFVFTAITRCLNGTINYFSKYAWENENWNNILHPHHFSAVLFEMLSGVGSLFCMRINSI